MNYNCAIKMSRDEAINEIHMSSNNTKSNNFNLYAYVNFDLRFKLFCSTG